MFLCEGKSALPSRCCDAGLPSPEIGMRTRANQSAFWSERIPKCSRIVYRIIRKPLDINGILRKTIAFEHYCGDVYEFIPSYVSCSDRSFKLDKLVHSNM